MRKSAEFLRDRLAQHHLASTRQAFQAMGDRVAHIVVPEIGPQLSLCFGAAIIPVFGDIRREIRVQRFDVVQRGAHIVSDQQIVEQLVFDAGHQRGAGTLERNADIALVAVEVDRDARSSGGHLYEPEMILQPLANLEVVLDLGLVFGSQRIRPAIAKFLGWFAAATKTPRIEWGNLVGFAVHPDKGGQDFGLVRQRCGLIVGELGNEVVGPNTVFALIALERRKRNHLVGTHRPGAPLRARCNRTTPLLGADEFASGGVKQVQHIRSTPSVQLKHVYFFKLLCYLPHSKRFAVVGGVVKIDDQSPIDIDQQHRVLILVGDRVDADPLGQPHPFPVGQHTHPMPGSGKVSQYPTAIMVG